MLAAVQPDGAVGSAEEVGDGVADQALGLRLDDRAHPEVGPWGAHRVGDRVRPALPLEQRVHGGHPALGVLSGAVGQRDADVLADLHARVASERCLFVVAAWTTTCRSNDLLRAAGDARTSTSAANVNRGKVEAMG
jgi:hypothetical protein